jgi:hypothetical protein
MNRAILSDKQSFSPEYSNGVESCNLYSVLLQLPNPLLPQLWRGQLMKLAFSPPQPVFKSIQHSTEDCHGYVSMCPSSGGLEELQPSTARVRVGAAAPRADHSRSHLVSYVQCIFTTVGMFFFVFGPRRSNPRRRAAGWLVCSQSHAHAQNGLIWCPC